jgi:NHL repeat
VSDVVWPVGRLSAAFVAVSLAAVGCSSTNPGGTERGGAASPHAVYSSVSPRTASTPPASASSSGVGPESGVSTPDVLRSAPASAAIAPMQPGPLAFGPDGRLYVSDEASNEVLVRAADGTFKVIAGSGTAGFSGDGGPATAAQLNNPQGLAVGIDGTVYVADQVNHRVRAIRPDGTIATVANSGANTDTHAVTISPDGGVYIASSVGIIELHPNRTVTTVATDNQLSGLSPPFGKQAGCEPDALAFDVGGDLYIDCYNSQSLLERHPNGIVTYRGSFRPHDASAALTALPNGGILQADGDQLVLVNNATQQPLMSFTATIPGVGGFWPQGIAAAPDGTMFASQDGAAGIGPAAIISIDSQHDIRVLWTGQ